MQDIARHVAVAARNVILTEALLLSQERIVNAAEEERRRLHDGLGPVLTAAATKVDATRNLLEKNPLKARDLLANVRRDLTTALGDLRRLVYALRPPVLDELGLLGALREQLQHAALTRGGTALEGAPAHRVASRFATMSPFAGRTLPNNLPPHRFARLRKNGLCRSYTLILGGSGRVP